MVDMALQGTFTPAVGVVLFSLVFLFLWRQSGVIYFAYWSLAFVAEALAWLCTALAAATGWPQWLAFRPIWEFGFALCLVAGLRAAPRIRYVLPILFLAFDVLSAERPLFPALRSLVLAAIYLYSFRQPALGPRRLFHFTLLALALTYLLSAPAYLLRLTYLGYLEYLDLTLKAVLAFSALAMWIQNQNERVTQIARELDRVRRETATDGSLDYLTGLSNQDSLRKRMDTDESFRGVVAVCDLDDFKSINDRFGHVVGDEVLRSVGNLLRSSIRAEDIAYRWGGDEFAILFHDREARPARHRMGEIEARLSDFRVRGYMSLRICFSWGVAEGNGAPLRKVMEHADREMYATKRVRSAARPSTGKA